MKSKESIERKMEKKLEEKKENIMLKIEIEYLKEKEKINSLTL